MFYSPSSAASVEPQASSTTSLSLAFSTTGKPGTWRQNLTVSAGSKLYVQMAYDNRGTIALRDASIYSRLPAGFKLVPNSTQSCVSPSSSETICNLSRGQGGALNESQIWSNSTLTVAPDAGLFDTPSDARSGLLDIGKVAFLNLVKCSYYNTRTGNTDNVFGFAPANQARAQTLCGQGSGEVVLRTANSAVYPTNIVGKSYVNMQVCDYINWAVNGGNTDEAVGTAPWNLPLSLSCGQFANPAIQLRLPHSSVETAYHRGFRYLRFLDAQYENISTGNTDDALSLTAALEPLLTMPFAEGEGNIRLSRERSLVQNIDLLDKARGKGFIQFQVVVPSLGGRYGMNATLSSSSVSSVSDAFGSVTTNSRSCLRRRRSR